MRWSPLGLAVALACAPGCGAERETRCEQAAREIRGILEECGVRFDNYRDELGERCTADMEAVYECYLDCYEPASCEAIRIEDEAGFEVLFDCTFACSQEL